MHKENILCLEDVHKFFPGGNRAVSGLTLEIRQGEIFTLLGPSGCGKTTTLRMIAGLEQPDQGEIRLHDKVLAKPAQDICVPPHKRRMGMVFQSYAIWPHLTVFETVAYPLRARRVRTAEIRKRVADMLELVGLQGKENRPGPALSGGQQQRVALARALVYEPEILLLDEPFSNLDAKLREQMRIELKLLQRRVGVTVILVTHDQMEALSLSDRMVVMNQGKAEQIGTPKHLYEMPATPFVKDFIGKSISLQAEIESVGGDKQVTVTMFANGSAHRLASKNNYCDGGKGQKVLVCVRPEDIVVKPNGAATEQNELEGTVDALLFVGDRFECHVRVGEQAMLVYAPRSQLLEEGQKVTLYFPPEDISVWPI
ncbi:MAG: ABC transporter ATP-binding protein [Burkholderiales bacterium]|nr:ABC transporter ATP-binding protein [Burkholderiales bacterium]